VRPAFDIVLRAVFTKPSGGLSPASNWKASWTDRSGIQAMMWVGLGPLQDCGLRQAWAVVER